MIAAGSDPLPFVNVHLSMATFLQADLSRSGLLGWPG